MADITEENLVEIETENIAISDAMKEELSAMGKGEEEEDA